MPGTLNIWSTLKMEGVGIYKILVNFYRLQNVIPQFNDDREMEAVISGNGQCEQFTAFMIICIMIVISSAHIMRRPCGFCNDQKVQTNPCCSPTHPDNKNCLAQSSYFNLWCNVIFINLKLCYALPSGNHPQAEFYWNFLRYNNCSIFCTGCNKLS
jgi:hypothetical protein